MSYIEGAADRGREIRTQTPTELGRMNKRQRKRMHKSRNNKKRGARYRST